MKNEFLKTFNASCPASQLSNLSPIVNQRSPFMGQQQVNFLWNLIAYGVYFNQIFFEFVLICVT
jgi:hypothetical protein